ncbi:MAG: hypothetical protein ACK4EX_02325 [Thermaurantimonas sp.]|uniref:HTH psq-type domain-containing protein n=1 Tax=Thermaurantimonas aggregans TaxID=2173829 RepID=A0A401XI26_9FLAO|nr:hypothetical protein [Thermaurantimonas aggregans]GCD76670.1 hypothetical protein JCM31826_01520 [Thermaurantimonas aggregans]
MQSTNVLKPTVAKRDRIKTEVVKWLAAKYKVSKNTIYCILRGEFNSPIEEEVLRDYRLKYNEIKKALKV